MKLLGAALSAMVLIRLQEAPCEHRTAGETRAVDLDRAARSMRDAEVKLRFAVERVRAPELPDAPFDSGLPACRGRERRTLRLAALPDAMVGKRVHFGPRRGGDLWVATSSPSLRDSVGAIRGSRDLADRLGIRCVPATVTVLSATEVEIVEE